MFGFSEIALLLVVASLFGIVANMLKQPLLVGFLFAGVVLSNFGFVGDLEVFSGLGQIGVTLLLFLVGLEMDLKDLKAIGKTALITGMGQIFFTVLFGFLIASLFGYSTLTSIYIAIALAFSLTIIIVKLLSEKKALDSLYGKISIGFLLVQDLVAVILLVYLAGIGGGVSGVGQYLFIGVKAVVLIGTIWFLSRKILPTLFEKYLASSQELLFISSMAWALGISSIVAGPVGFSYEIGGFLAGIALSNLPEHLHIASKTKPLRDFFLTIFFMLLGTKLSFANLDSILIPATVFSIFVLVGNPTIVMSILGALGYKKRTSFLSGLTVAQISEFSLIIAALGLSLGHIDNEIMSIVVLVAVITMTTSTYLVKSSDKIYKKLNKSLSLFERKVVKETALASGEKLSNHIILVGAGRTGKSLSKYFKRRKEKFVIVDFNPHLFTSLTADNLPVLFGDINDSDITEAAGLKRAKLVVSTISNKSDNLALLDEIKNEKNKPITVFTALSKTEAVVYYEAGIDRVILPQTVAADYIKHIFSTYGSTAKKISVLGKNHFKRLLYNS